MLHKFFEFEKKFSITKAATIVALFTMLAKLVALIRDPLFASKFGGDNIYILDIYNAAFRIPDFVFNVFILGTLSVALIPVFVDLLVKDENRAKNVANTIITLTMLIIGGVFVLLYIFAFPLTKLLVPGFSGERLAQTVQLSRIIILSQIIFTLSNICTNLLYSYKRFIMAGVAPVLYNIGIILGIVLFYPRFGLQGLGYGVMLGAIMHLLVQIPELLRSSFHLKPAWYVKDEALKKFWKLYVPRIFVIDLSIFSLLISTFIASKLETGSIAIFTLAINLQTIPVSVIALSLATAMFPALSEARAKKQNFVFLNILKKTLIQIFYFMLPLTILMLVFRAQGVRLYLGHGNFTWSNTILTFQTLGILTFSLLSQSLAPILARAFYSRQNTIIPVTVNIFAMAINAILAFYLGRRFGILGVAAAFSIASLFNASTLYIVLRNNLNSDNLQQAALKEFDCELGTVIGKIMMASIMMGLFSYAGLRLFAPLVNTHTVLGLATQAACAGMLGLAAFFFTGWKIKLRESRIVLDYFKKIMLKF